jgi:hypothetical protein
MADDISRNLLYFESDSMRGLYEAMDSWQIASGKRRLTTNVQRDGAKFCCIALTNPMEVVICSGHDRPEQAAVLNGKLWVTT